MNIRIGHRAAPVSKRIKTTKKTRTQVFRITSYRDTKQCCTNKHPTRADNTVDTLLSCCCIVVHTCPRVLSTQQQLLIVLGATYRCCSTDWGSRISSAFFLYSTLSHSISTFQHDSSIFYHSSFSLCRNSAPSAALPLVLSLYPPSAAAALQMSSSPDPRAPGW